MTQHGGGHARWSLNSVSLKLMLRVFRHLSKGLWPTHQYNRHRNSFCGEISASLTTAAVDTLLGLNRKLVMETWWLGKLWKAAI